MFDQSISSINLSGLSFLDAAMDFTDLAFLEMVLCMSETDQALATKMKEIRAINKLKKSLTHKIDLLDQWIDRSDSITDGTKKKDVVYVPGGLNDPGNPEDNDAGHLNHNEQKSLEKECRKDFIPGNMSLDELHDKDVFLRSEVENQIERLRTQLEEQNSSSSILMLDLQRIMNKRNEAMQLVSSLESKNNQTATAIIANLK